MSIYHNFWKFLYTCNIAFDKSKLIKDFEKMITKKIIFSLKKVLCKRVVRDFRFIFVGV